MASEAKAGPWRGWVWSPLVAGLKWFPLVVATLCAAPVRRAAYRWRRIAPDTRTSNARALGAALLSLLPSLLAFIAAVLLVYLAWAGWLYPLRPDTFPHLADPFTRTKDLSHSWGGDYLAGAWLAHALIGTGMQLVSLLILHGLLKIRDMIARLALSPSSNG